MNNDTPPSVSGSIDRRMFLSASAAAAGAVARPSGAADPASRQQVSDWVKRLIPKRKEVDDWLAGRDFPFGKYDPELGYLHLDRDFKEGVDGSVASYRYDELDARRMFAYADQPCRINTYGNSFTSCEQVSDGETWQEVLASHLGEPLRNYGIGGYSVYQAYRRMLREEKRAPARYIIFNIFDDDHYRNLHCWARLKFGVPSVSMNPPVPYVRVDPDQGIFEERENPCPTPQSLYNLCDSDWILKNFGDNTYLLGRIRRDQRRDHGEQVSGYDYDDEELTRYGIFATKRIVEKVQAYASANDRKVLFVLSYGGYVVQRYIEDKYRFDQELRDFMTSLGAPFVDTLEAHARDFAQFKVDTATYLRRYYVGHYNPMGNMFQAFAIKNKLVEILDPKPSGYSKT